MLSLYTVLMSSILFTCNLCSPLLQHHDHVHDDTFSAHGPKEFKEVTDILVKDAKKLHRMGVFTALAVGLHNVPEGLATLIGTLSNPALGASLAFAIAVHNIPEGVCVAMPVYYATGSKFRTFFWTFLSGVAEPIGTWSLV